VVVSRTWQRQWFAFASSCVKIPPCRTIALWFAKLGEIFGGDCIKASFSVASPLCLHTNFHTQAHRYFLHRWFLPPPPPQLSIRTKFLRRNKRSLQHYQRCLSLRVTVYNIMREYRMASAYLALCGTVLLGQQVGKNIYNLNPLFSVFYVCIHML